MNRRLPLVALAGAQFIMVLDQSVMNVSISQLVAEFDTTVTVIQAVITLYCLVMAMLMLTGGKIGDIIGRRRAFVIGLVIYACGSGLTAVSQTVAQLTLGWSILEGIGAALVLPAMAALIAGNFEGRERKAAYAVIGGVAGAGIAIGPILGGWATTELSMAGRVRRRGRDRARHPRDGPLRRGRGAHRPEATARRHRLGAVGGSASACSSSASSSRPRGARSSPRTRRSSRSGSPLTPFVIAAGAGLIWGFVKWQRRRERVGSDPLVHLDLVRIPTLRARPRGPVLSEPHPHGRVLHDPVVPPARPRARRAPDGPEDAARLDRHVHRGRGRVTPVNALYGPGDHPGRPGDHLRLLRAPSGDDPARPG